jgi:hypothetical protein
MQAVQFRKRKILKMTTTQKLNAYFTRKFLQKLELDSAYREKIDKILGLLKKANPADLQVKVSEVRGVLYPELSTVSTHRALDSLANQINERAEEQGGEDRAEGFFQQERCQAHGLVRRPGARAESGEFR